MTNKQRHTLRINIVYLGLFSAFIFLHPDHKTLAGFITELAIPFVLLPAIFYVHYLDGFIRISKKNYIILSLIGVSLYIPFVLVMRAGNPIAYMRYVPVVLFLAGIVALGLMARGKRMRKRSGRGG